jgi:hypothetical protein
VGRRRKLDLPAGLLDAVREQRAVLFLGSGASLDAKNPNDQAMPGSTQLASLNNSLASIPRLAGAT